jgi:Domain of unknown function (DUF6754)
MLLVISGLVLYFIQSARRGRQLFVRRIPGLGAIDEAVGRATEMGRPITYNCGVGAVDIVMIQSVAIAVHVVRLAARYMTRVIMTLADSALYAIADEAVREAYAAEGRPELYNAEDVRFLSDSQFAYAAGVVGIIHREQVASNFMFGYYYAESLILAEAGHEVGAIQVAGTTKTTQVPFFITSCDYTIIGDEYYAATAYLSREPVLLGSLIGQDYGKILILVIILVGALAALLSATHLPFVADALSWFPKLFEPPKG